MDSLKSLSFVLALMVLTSTAQAAGGEEKAALVQDLKDIRISILQKQKVAGFYSAYLKIETPGQEQADLLQKLLPRVRDALLIGLSSYLPIIWSRDDEPSYDTMVSLIESTVRSVCPPDTIQKVYLTKAHFSLPRRR